MLYTMYYPSPLGRMLLAADEEGLVGAWFEGQKYYGSVLGDDILQEKNDILRRAEQWLDLYFSGTEPDFMPAIHLTGSDFRKQVWSCCWRFPMGRPELMVISRNRLPLKMEEKACPPRR